MRSTIFSMYAESTPILDPDVMRDSVWDLFGTKVTEVYVWVLVMIMVVVVVMDTVTVRLLL